MDIWDITNRSTVWKPDDGCRVWATSERELPTIPSYFRQTHRNSVASRRLKKSRKGKVSPVTAKLKNGEQLQWNDVYHAKAESVPLTDGTYQYPVEQWCYEGGNGIHSTLTIVKPGITIFCQARYYNSWYDPRKGRRCSYGIFRYWEMRVINGLAYIRSVGCNGADNYEELGSPCRIHNTSKGLEDLKGTVICSNYIHEGGYNPTLEEYRVVCRHYVDQLQGLIPMDAPWQPAGTVAKVSVNAPSLDLEFSFLLNENGLINGYGPLGILQSGMVRQELLEKATFETMNTVLTTWDNGIQNLQGILELGKLLKELKNGDFSSLPKKANDLWLQYRYVFSTSKMDAEDAIEAVMRRELREKLAAGGSILVTGQSTYASDDLHIICKCHMQIKSLASLLAEQLLTELDNWGMIPDTYLVWDMIPYSFIVDWFVPIGDALAVNDANNKFVQQYLIEKCMYSFAYTREIEGVQVSNYSRWVDAPVWPNGFTFMANQYDGTSTKTIFKRIVDVWALLGGK